MNTELLQTWRDFLEADPITHYSALVERMVGDSLNCDWNLGPVEAFVPGVIEEFRAISKRLGELHAPNPTEWEKAWSATRALFKAGCDFGDAMENFGEAFEDGSDNKTRRAMNRVRNIFAVIETLAADES